jgi:transposase
MQAVTTIGLDIAKSVFQIHGVDAAGNVIVRRQLKRLGHTVRLMPPADVRPYVKGQKNDAADAEAICEAVTRANMRFVPTKTLEQQSCLMLHRTRHLFIRQQTAVINAIRAHLAEFGIVAPVGRNGAEQLLDVVADASDKRLPEIARACLLALGAQLRTQPVHGRRVGRHPLCQDPWHQTPALAYGIVGAAAHQGGRDRACQQDRKNGVGHAGQPPLRPDGSETRGVHVL